MSDRETEIIKYARSVMQEHDVTLSENDVINFLIQCASLAYPLTTAEARSAIEQHWDVCPEGCSPTPPPKCALGVHLVRNYNRVASAEQLRYAGPQPAEAAAKNGGTV